MIWLEISTSYSAAATRHPRNEHLCLYVYRKIRKSQSREYNELSYTLEIPNNPRNPEYDFGIRRELDASSLLSQFIVFTTL